MLYEVITLQYEVIQYPSGGILGFFKKEAIIVASCKQSEPVKTQKQTEVSKKTQPSEFKTPKEHPKKESKTPVVIEEDTIVENFFKDVSKTEVILEEPVSYRNNFV